MSSPGHSTYVSLQARGRDLDNKIKFRESQEFRHLIEAQITSPKDNNMQQVVDYLNEDSMDAEGEPKLMINASSIQRLPRREMNSTQPEILRKVMAMDEAELRHNIELHLSPPAAGQYA